MSEVHRMTTAIVILSAVGFGVAAYVWYQGQTRFAVITAIFAYGLFRAFKPLSLIAAKLRLKSRPGFAQTLLILENELIDRKPHDVLREIESRIEEIRRAKIP